MAEKAMSPVGRRQTHVSDIEVVWTEDKECVECKPHHVCRQCNARWDGLEPLLSPQVTIIREPGLKQRWLLTYQNHYWYFRIAFGIIAAIVIVIIVVLVVMLRPKQPIGIYRSGSGLVALDRGDDSAVVDIFFQHADGQIRHVVLNDTSKQWTNGLSEDNVIGQYAPAPRQGTPLMAVSYMIGIETTWKVFYIDTNNILQESTASTMTDNFPTVWLPGPLGLRQLKAHSSPHTGLSVCKYMLWSPDASGLNNGALVLLYGGSDGKNHMLTHQVQDTVWKDNYTFPDSAADSGIECTVRGSPILDTWMINSKGQLLQSSFNFDTSSNNTITGIYSAGGWTSGVVYNQALQTPTSISAIKYTGNSSVFQTNSTFVHFVVPGGIISEVNIDTNNRTHLPEPTPESWNVSSSSIVGQSKIASLALRTSVRNPKTTEHGQDSKIFLQLQDNPGQISVMSGNFYEAALSSTLEVVSNIQQ